MRTDLSIWRTLARCATVLGALATAGCFDFRKVDTFLYGDRATGTGVGAQGYVASQSVSVPAAVALARANETERTTVGRLPSPAANNDALVRAPEIFQASTIALWDGRRTARGVWVAHPDVRKPLPVSIVNLRTGTEIEGIAYRQGNSDVGDVLTVSSDAAAALDMQPRQRERLTVFALRPRPAVSRAQRSTAANTAENELASHIGRMPHNELLQLAAAAMRGMGYATAFRSDAGPDGLPVVRAFAQEGGAGIPAITVSVRPGTGTALSARDVAQQQAIVTQTGGVGVIISIPGFARDAGTGLTRAGGHVELVDLDGFMNIWLTHYEALSEPDRALLRLEPVYFLAGQ